MKSNGLSNFQNTFEGIESLLSESYKVKSSEIKNETKPNASLDLEGIQSHSQIESTISDYLTKNNIEFKYNNRAYWIKNKEGNYFIAATKGNRVVMRTI